VKSFGLQWSSVRSSISFHLFALVALTSTAFAGSGQLSANPSIVNFNGVPVGTSQTQAVTLTNSGGSRVTINQASVSAASFTLSGMNLPVTLSGGQSAIFYVTFSAQSTGSSSGGISIAYRSQMTGKGRGGFLTGYNSSLTLPVSGTGVNPNQLTANPSSLLFGNIQLGSSQSLTEILTNSGGASVTISAVVPTSSFTLSGLSLPIVLSGGQSVSFTVTFSPSSAGTIVGGMTVTSDASNPTLIISMSGTGITQGQLTASPASLDFGSVAVGGSATIGQTLTNSGGSSLTISQISPSGTGFTFSGITLPVTVPAAQSVMLNVSFAPSSGGAVAGSLGITSTGSNPSLSVPLKGTGSLPGQLTLSPATLDFGSVVIGTTQSQTGTLSAGSSAITVTSAGVSGSQFSVSGIALPVTIPAGNSISYQLAYAPQTSGAASSNVTFVSNASNSPTIQSLTGTGTSPQHSVGLSWNTSTSSDVVGYNIYRGSTSAGPYTKLNAVLDTAPFSTDSAVQAGQTYYYVTTAVDSLGMESQYSNSVQAIVPSP
jgi:hypothetical protein